MKAILSNIIKGILFACLVPVVVAVTISFIERVDHLLSPDKRAFFYGVIAYVVCHLFIAEFGGIYHFGERLMEDIFQAISPFMRYVAYILPFYSIVLLIFMYFSKYLPHRPAWVNEASLFFVGFTFAMHLIFTARILKESDPNVVKPAYFLSFSVVYILSVFFVAVLLSVALSKFSFPHFWDTSVTYAKKFYTEAFHQLFP